MEFSNEEDHEQLGGLLEKLHQAGYVPGGNMTIVYVAKGAQHVGYIQTQNVYEERRREPAKASMSGALPDVLATEAAMALWRKAQDAGYIDENYQPLLPRPKAALLADKMASLLGIRNKWQIFGSLWNRNNMRSDYNRALAQHQTLEFQDLLKQVF
jgi:hypothetical protein